MSVWCAHCATTQSVKRISGTSRAGTFNRIFTEQSSPNFNSNFISYLCHLHFAITNDEKALDKVTLLPNERLTLLLNVFNANTLQLIRKVFVQKLWKHLKILRFVWYHFRSLPHTRRSLSAFVVVFVGSTNLFLCRSFNDNSFWFISWIVFKMLPPLFFPLFIH